MSRYNYAKNTKTKYYKKVMSRTYHHTYWWKDEFERAPREKWKWIRVPIREDKFHDNIIHNKIDSIYRAAMNKLCSSTPEQVLSELDIQGDIVKRVLQHNPNLTALYFWEIPNALLIEYTPTEPLSRVEIAKIRNRLYAMLVMLCPTPEQISRQKVTRNYQKWMEIIENAALTKNPIADSTTDNSPYNNIPKK